MCYANWAGVGNGSSILTILLVLPAISSAQISSPSQLAGPKILTESEQTATQKSQPRNLLLLAELNQLDVKFHKELDVAQEASDREAFGDAEQALSQLAQEIEGLIKRISVSVLPKNSFFEIDGVRKPATTETETEWFTRTLNKAQQRRNRASILRKVTDMQKQAADLLSARKYPEDRDAYQKSADLLADNRSQLDDQDFQFFGARSENGRRLTITTFWANQFGTLRDRYNRTTEDAKLSPEEIHRTIKSVADEIVNEGYIDPVKHPDMPEDARALFHNLLDAANQYLGPHQ